jgi:riboflavin kinase/FMN adenylyltransferase
MTVLDWENFIAKAPTRPSSCAIGVFDGVHRGHTALIELIVSHCPCPTVVSFRENPKKRFSRGPYEGDIFSLEQKLRVFEELGVERTILIDFSVDFSKLGGREFIDLLEDRGNLVFLVIGSNFRCGHNQDTDAAFIKTRNEKKGIATEVVSPVLEGNCPVSSSRIRAAILAGNLAEAAKLLGRPVELDLSGVIEVQENPGTERVYDLASCCRLTPANGRYLALLHKDNSPELHKMEISVHNGRVFIPSPFSASRIELLL